MGADSKIEWTDATWNPVRGCTKISAGCKNCYAETFSERWRGVKGHPFEQGFDLRLVPEKLAAPLKWKKPRRIFVNSMSDLFHEDVPDDYIARVFGVMAAAPQHTFQVLTKRVERMARWFATDGQGPSGYVEHHARHHLTDQGIKLPAGKMLRWPLPHVWLGVSVENQAAADERIPYLVRVPAAVRFLSCEPLLGPVTFRPRCNTMAEKIAALDTGDASRPAMLDGIDWVIVGGESGPGARMFDGAWARAIIEQCRVAGVAPFVKQLGAIALDTDYHGFAPLTLLSRKGGDPAEWEPDLRIREFPITKPTP